MKAFLPQKAALALTALFLSAAVPAAFGASHRDAPGQLGDPDANITDVYAFVNSANTVTLSMNVHPFIDPDEGPIWPFFSPDVLYEIHVKNNPTITNGNAVFSGPSQISYQFRFSPPAYQNTNTILTEGRGTGLDAGPIMHVGDAHQNMIQTYSVTRVDEAIGARTPLDSDRPMIVPPPNVGKRATPLYNDANGMALPGAVDAASLDTYTKEATYNLGGNRLVFAGMREDGFYFDQGGTFDLLNLRNPGIDTFAGLNVLNITLQVPTTDLLQSGASPSLIIGVYATSSRRLVTVRRQASPDGRNNTFNGGSFQVVSRMGNPLFNEALVAIQSKDRYNQVRPDEGNDEEFRTYAENPELAVLLNAVTFSSADPVAGPIKTSGRTDLSAIFIPDLLKLDVSTGPVPLAGTTGFSRLSFLGGDTIQSGYQGKAVPSGWPNGRRYGDDVIDIALSAIGAVNNGAAPFNNGLVILSDNANSNDVTYPLVFPYLGVPHSGLNHKHHGQPAPPAATTTNSLLPSLQQEPGRSGRGGPTTKPLSFLLTNEGSLFEYASFPSPLFRRRGGNLWRGHAMRTLSHLVTAALIFTLPSGILRAEGEAPQDLSPTAGTPSSAPSVSVHKTLAAPTDAVDTSGVKVSKTDKEITTWEEKTKINPNDSAAWVSLSEAYLQKARENNDPDYYTLCEAALNKGQALKTDDYRAMRLRSVLHSTRHQFPKAIEWTEKAIKINPSDPVNFGNLGDIYAELGDYDKAEDNYQKMVDLKPGRAAYARASYMQELYGNEKAARSYMLMAISAGSPTGEGTAWCYAYLGNLEFNAGFLPAAEKAYNAALTAFPGFFHAYNGLGQVMVAKKNYPAAISMFDKAIQNGPQHAVLGQLIEICTLTGQKEKANEYHKRLTDLNEKYHKNQMDIDFEIAEIDAEQGKDLKNALALAKDEIKVHANIKAYDGLAWIAYLNNDLDTALDAAENAMAVGEQSSLMFYHAAKIHEKMGHKQESIYLMNRALSRCPYFHPRYADDARATVSLLTKQLQQESIASAAALSNSTASASGASEPKTASSSAK